MPYIKQSDRGPLTPAAIREPETPGELNYQITVIVQRYFYNNGRNYQAINDVLGALDGASKEFYRRIAAPYEDTKIKQNGDVI